jgi:hypothetical protein
VLISDAYEFLLNDFSLHDKEKAEQTERMNEVRAIYGMKTGNWWIDEVVRWMNVHRMKLKPGVLIIQRQIPGLIDLQLDQEQPSPIESEYEDVDATPWIETVEKVSGTRTKQIASGIEVDVIRSNIQELMKRMDEVDSGHKRELEGVKVTSDNAFRLNEQILEKLQEFNETNTRIREDIERRIPPPHLKEIDIAVEDVEEDTEDELRSNSDTETQTESEPENELPEDIRMLKVMMMDILNEEIKNTIPRIQMPILRS